ncbi:MAG TPA: hypothetical protein VIJ25_19100 [Methylococcales bacterium]
MEPSTSPPTDLAALPFTTAAGTLLITQPVRATNYNTWLKTGGT